MKKMEKVEKVEKVNKFYQFVGSGIPGCPFVTGHPEKLEFGKEYKVTLKKDEPSMLMLYIPNLDSWIPAQWFNPSNHPTVPTN